MDNPIVHSLGPLANADARVLILGSMPGLQSLSTHQYYAHPRNAFWAIMSALFGADAELPYAERVRQLQAQGVALWDVIACCERSGSLDAHIRSDSVQVNDIPGLLDQCPSIELIACNGRTAERWFRRAVLPAVERSGRSVQWIGLPSTSPAYAAMSRVQKVRIWDRALG
ncbi:MAG: DNA-deoxyinosine glycosylase [Pseudomonadota bacterium]